MNLLVGLSEVVVPIYIVIAIGFWYGRRFDPDLGTINHLTPGLFFPALFLDRLPAYDYALGETAALLGAAALILLLCGLLVWPLVRTRAEDTRAVLATVMFNNAGNIGLPVALLAFGEPGLQPALLLMVVQTAMNVIGGEFMFSGRFTVRAVLTSPLILSMVAGIALGVSGLQLPGLIATPIGMLADIAIPLVLFAMGARFASVQAREIGVGIAYGIVRPLSGLLAYLLVRPWFALSPMHADLLLIFSVLPPAVFNFLLAERHGYHASLIASITMIGNLIGFVSLALAVGWIR